MQFKIKKQLPDAEHDMYRLVMRSKALKCLQQIILSNKEELATWKHGDVPTNQHEFLASLLTEIVNDLDKNDRGADRCVN